MATALRATEASASTVSFAIVGSYDAVDDVSGVITRTSSRTTTGGPNIDAGAGRDTPQPTAGRVPLAVPAPVWAAQVGRDGSPQTGGVDDDDADYDGASASRRRRSWLGRAVQALTDLVHTAPSPTMFRWIREWRTINLMAMGILVVLVVVYLVDPIVLITLQPTLLDDVGVSPWIISLYERRLWRLMRRREGARAGPPRAGGRRGAGPAV